MRTTARDVVPNNPEATIWRDSGARVRGDASTCSATLNMTLRSFRDTGCLRAARQGERLTVIAVRLEWFPRAAPKRRHVLFPAFCFRDRVVDTSQVHARI